MSNPLLFLETDLPLAGCSVVPSPSAALSSTPLRGKNAASTPETSPASSPASSLASRKSSCDGSIQLGRAADASDEVGNQDREEPRPLPPIQLKRFYTEPLGLSVAAATAAVTASTVQKKCVCRASAATRSAYSLLHNNSSTNGEEHTRGDAVSNAIRRSSQTSHHAASPIATSSMFTVEDIEIITPRQISAYLIEDERQNIASRARVSGQAEEAEAQVLARILEGLTGDASDTAPSAPDTPKESFLEDIRRQSVVIVPDDSESRQRDSVAAILEESRQHSAFLEEMRKHGIVVVPSEDSLSVKKDTIGTDKRSHQDEGQSICALESPSFCVDAEEKSDARHVAAERPSSSAEDTPSGRVAVRGDRDEGFFAEMKKSLCDAFKTQSLDLLDAQCSLAATARASCSADGTDGAPVRETEDCGCARHCDTPDIKSRLFSCVTKEYHFVEFDV